MGRIELPVGDEHYRAIGRVVVSFAALEKEIEFFIWHLISNEQRVGQIVTAELSFRNLLNLFSSMFRYQVTDTQKIKQLESLLKKANTAEEKRNRIVHSVWAVGSAADIRTRIKATAKQNEGFKPKSEEMSVKEVDNIADSIFEVTGEIHGFMLRWMGMLA